MLTHISVTRALDTMKFSSLFNGHLKSKGLCGVGRASGNDKTIFEAMLSVTDEVSHSVLTCSYQLYAIC